MENQRTLFKISTQTKILCQDDSDFTTGSRKLLGCASYMVTLLTIEDGPFFANENSILMLC